ncbi:multidrug resistance protein MdtE [Ditylenchus destructor]|nr:multidrug resistance protein MdtE [Ditylenchus destructor]
MSAASWTSRSPPSTRPFRAASPGAADRRRAGGRLRCDAARAHRSDRSGLCGPRRREASSGWPHRQRKRKRQRQRNGLGQRHSATVLRSGGEAYDLKAKVLFSGMSVDASTGDVLLRVLVENPRRDLLPGMFVRARIPMASYQQALRVPQQAVVRAGDAAKVWVLSRNDHARLADVTLGELVDRQYRVVKGVRAGDRVVVTGMERLAEGVKVQLASAAAPVSAASAPIAQ